MNDLSDILNPSHCLSQTQLIAYIQQKLEREEVYLVESHLNDCPFCSDALEGLMESDLDLGKQHLVEIKKHVETKLEELRPKQTAEIPASNHSSKKSLSVTNNKTYRWLAAASVLFLIGLGGYSVFSYISKQDRELALQEKNSTSSVEAPYKMPENAETGEVVHVEISADSLKNISSDDKIEKKELSKIEEIKTVPQTTLEDKSLAKSTTKPQFTPPPVTSSKEIIEKALVPAAEVSKSNADQSVQENDYVNNGKNYAQEEKVVAETKTPLSKKTSSVGMKKSNNESFQLAPAANQLNYSTYSNNDNNNKNYKDQEIENIRTKQDDSKSAYETGLGFYNEGNYKKATKVFEKAMKKASGQELEDIQFHLAQAYLKLGRNSEAESLLNKLANSSKYKNNALELKKQVGEPTKKK
ncbi:MAG: tetratricopeptide repeat protein [Chitinophagaceae bacterium]|nr:tetratricopeptide repeat protein [Chitinophagaceae bacterium]